MLFRSCGVNGETVELNRPINEDANVELYKFEDEAAKACEKMAAYSNQGDYSGLYALASEAYEKSPNLLKLLPITADASGMGEQIRQKLQGDSHTFQQVALCILGKREWHVEVEVARYISYPTAIAGFVVGRALFSFSVP